MGVKDQKNISFCESEEDKKFIEECIDDLSVVQAEVDDREFDLCSLIKKTAHIRNLEESWVKCYKLVWSYLNPKIYFWYPRRSEPNHHFNSGYFRYTFNEFVNKFGKYCLDSVSTEQLLDRGNGPAKRRKSSKSQEPPRTCR